MATLFSAAETFAAQEKYTEAIQQYEFLANGKRNSDKTRSKAAFALGKLFYATESPTSGRQKSLYWFRCAVSHGNLEAAKTLQNDTMLPRLLQLGLPLPLCCRTAENCQRDSDQMCCLCGNAIVISKKNVTVSACCGALTHAKCKHELGDVYCACPSCGRGFLKAGKRQFKQVQKHVKNGATWALSVLADLTYFGSGCKASPEKARKLYLRSAENGDAKGMYNYALLCQNGEGGSKDLYLAEKWFRGAIELGDAEAAVNLAAIMSKSAKNLKAHQLHLWGAAQGTSTFGYMESCCNLGMTYKNGRHGLEVNTALARQYFIQAASQGYIYARTVLEEMDVKEMGGRFCASCKITETSKRKFLHCKRCVCTHYCGHECQKNHWKVHKRYCKKRERLKKGNKGMLKTAKKTAKKAAASK